jgi:hypothetical protein
LQLVRRPTAAVGAVAGRLTSDFLSVTKSAELLLDSFLDLNLIQLLKDLIVAK